MDERSRHDLFERLRELLGAEAAVTLMEHLPPVGWADVATKQDLDRSQAATKQDLERLAAALRQEVGESHAALRQDFERSLAATKRDIETTTKRDLGALEERVDARFAVLTHQLEAVEQRLLATFRGELVTAISSQTRTMVFTMAGTVVSLSGVALAFSRFG